MIILLLLSFFYENENYDIALNRNRLSCHNLDIIFGTNISLICNSPNNLTIQYTELSNFLIDAEKRVNIINNSYHNSHEKYIKQIKESISILNSTKIIFTDFLSTPVIEKFKNVFSLSYKNILITFEWNKHGEKFNSNCEWENTTNLPTSFLHNLEALIQSSKWNKLCINNHAYLHHIEKNSNDEIIIITKTKMIIIIVLICSILIIVIISLYLIALCKYKNSHQQVENSHKEDNEEEENDPFCINSDDDNDESKENSSKKTKYYYEVSNDSEDEDEAESFFVSFLKQLFNVGNNSGSIIFESINLVRTFQKISSTKSFSIFISKECLKMFSWATKLIEIIISNFYFRKLSNLENFYFINYVFPILIITFIISLIIQAKYFIFLVFLGLFTALGFGFGYIKYDYKISLCFIFPSIALIVIIIFFFVRLLCNKKDNKKDNKEDNCIDHIVAPNIFPITSSSLNALITISIILIPFFIDNLYFLGSCLFVFLIVIFIIFIIDLIFICNMGIGDNFGTLEFIPAVFSNILTLLFIPSTSIFVELISNEYKNNWNIIVGYIMFSLIIPIFLNIIIKSIEKKGEIR